jgi:hypothetical protein
MMNEKRRLWIVDPSERFPADLLERLSRFYFVVRTGFVEKRWCPFEDGKCDGVVVVANGSPHHALLQAGDIKRAHREAVVLLLGVPRTEDILHDAIRAGIDTIVDSDSRETLYGAIVTRIPPVEVAL